MHARRNLSQLILVGLMTLLGLASAASQQTPVAVTAATDSKRVASRRDEYRCKSDVGKARQSFVVDTSGIIECDQRTANFIPYATPIFDSLQIDIAPHANSNPTPISARWRYCRRR